MFSNPLGNRYQVLRTLGAGGFGTTFLAEDIQMPSRRKCVIKQLKPIADNPQIHQLVQERFQREATILEAVGNGHDLIPDLYAYFSEGGHFYLIQEWVDGLTLREKVQTEGCVDEGSARQMLIDVLPVLGYVHQQQIVHRDIKPDNIILRKRDSKPVLIDFGAVRETMGTMVNTQGQAGSSIVIGTPGFMPSEQAAGRPLYSSDLYSLGLTMIYLLTGKFPQELDSNPATGEIIWRRFAPQISPEFAAVLDKAIEYHPRDRYASAAEMLSDLQQRTRPMPVLDPTMAPNTVIPEDNEPMDRAAAMVPPTIVNPVGGIPTQPQGAALMATATGPAPVPPEIPGWNWGAFLLPGLWCVNNQVWWGLLSWIGCVPFVPMIGWLATGGVLGAKGNEWAWKSRSWRSVEEFQRNQKHWAIAGFITWGSMVGLITAVMIFAPSETSTNGSSPSLSEASPDSSISGSGDAPPVIPSDLPSEQPSAISPAANVYPADEVEAYMESCVNSATKSGASADVAQNYCTCTIDKIQARYTFTEFAKIVVEMQASQQMPPEINQIVDECRPTGGL